MDLTSYKRILHIALPAIAGLSTQMIVSLIDTAMVGRLDNAEFALAAMGLGVLATWALISFFSSFATGTHIYVARAYGSNDFKTCSENLNTSIILAITVGIFVAFIGMTFSYDISDFFAADDHVGILAGDYLHYRFMGIPFFLITVSYRGFFFGIGKTKIFMYSGLLVNFLNIIFNYIFIFGGFGIKGMGLAGAGIGSTLATMCDSLFYFLISMRTTYRDKFQFVKHMKFIPSFAYKIIRISLPVSIQNIFILVGFLVFIAITGLIGIREQAASQLITSALFISLMPCFGFGIAAQTLVANSIGAKDVVEAKQYGINTSRIAILYTTFVGIIFIVFPDHLLSIITEDDRIIFTAVPALRIAGIGQIFYAVGVVFANGLQAAGNSFFVMVNDLISNWIIFLPLAFVLGVILNFGLIGAWAALPVYIVIYSFVNFLKFKYGKWNVFV
ncbi:MAG: MATE family efflux transporter [Bacteroidetes bacterium]|nr:MATE family efflux transporter [Bacteroidota bacterium]MBU1678996.1 MATE family efflux transporter [Bacteroidota bacterium]MBU2506015.1 MATE family efflux transporter [Bacteroidota bacterium]